MLGDELLVGGDDVALRLERREHVLSRRVDPAHQLDDDLGFLEDLAEVPLRAPQDADDLGPAPGGRLDLVRLRGDQVAEGAADRAAPKQADANRLAHTSLPLRSA